MPLSCMWLVPKSQAAGPAEHRDLARTQLGLRRKNCAESEASAMLWASEFRSLRVKGRSLVCEGSRTSAELFDDQGLPIGP